VLGSDGLAARSAIDESLARAAALIEETGARMQEPALHLMRADLAALDGAAEVRERELRDAERLFAEMGAPIRAAEVAAMLGTRGVER